ncbi:nuclear transport factor 2 family protein, partial [Kibdelosporangium lantanae]
MSDTTIHLFFRAVDTRDWDTVAATLADQVTLDYTSLFGGEVETLTPDEITGRWRGLLPGFDATMHMLGPLVDDGDTVRCNVRAYHHIDGRTWMVAGWYTLHIVQSATGARIAGIRIESSYEEGGRDLVELA